MDFKIDFTKSFSQTLSLQLTALTVLGLFILSRFSFPNLGFILSALLLLAAIVNLLPIIKVDAKLSHDNFDFNFRLENKPINIVIFAAAVIIFFLFAGHLVADSVSCLYGRASAC